MAKPPRSLTTLKPTQEKLGLPTIMTRALAARHGVRYVRLAAFAIDVDRVREAIDLAEDYATLPEGHERALPPFGWEVFLTTLYLLRTLDPEGREEDRGLIEEACVSILEGDRGALGGQLAFAAYVAVERGLWPASLRPLFGTWKTKPKALLQAVGRLFEREEEERRALAELCLEAELEPPLAPPTIEALRALAEARLEA